MTKKMKTSLACAALAGVLAIGGIAAYFTDGDTATNTFNIGKVSIDLQEPDWVPPTNIVPEQEIAKDPQIKNDGINDAYMFLEVSVPYANVVTANEDGTKNAQADTQLFNYDVKAGWVQVGNAVKDETNKVFKYVYAYGTNEAMTVVSANATTGELFSHVRFANVVEDQGLEGTNLDILINAYGIQTTNINDSDTTIDGNNADGKVAPSDVWAVVKAQAPSTTVAGAEVPNTDVKQAQ